MIEENKRENKVSLLNIMTYNFKNTDLSASQHLLDLFFSIESKTLQ